MKNMLKSLLILSALLFFSPQGAMAAPGESYPEKVGDKLPPIGLCCHRFLRYRRE